MIMVTVGRQTELFPQDETEAIELKKLDEWKRSNIVNPLPKPSAG